MITILDFKLGCHCDTSKIIKHFDKYPEFEGKRFMKSGRSTKIFKSYIQRKFSHDKASTLFREYVKWYKLAKGSEDGVWNSWKQLCHTDFDLTHGYLWYEFLIHVPVLETTFDNIHKHSTYIGALKYAIYYDLIRYGRFSTISEVYNIDGYVIFKMLRKLFRDYTMSIVDKCDAGGCMSYENFRVLKWIALIYDSPIAKKLITNVEVKRRSKSSLVYNCTNKKIILFNKKNKDVARGYSTEPIPDTSNVKSISEISKSIWDIVNQGEDDG